MAKQIPVKPLPINEREQLQMEKESIQACYEEEHDKRKIAEKELHQLQEQIELYQEANRNLQKELKEKGKTIEYWMDAAHKTRQQLERSENELARYGDVVLEEQKKAKAWEAKYKEMAGIENDVKALMDKYRGMAVR